MQELEASGHWSQVGRMGEYAAGNGAAMRIAPFAFWDHYSREDVRDFCRITHRNDEAYVGALAVVVAIRQILNGGWDGEGNLIELIIPQLPDTNVRDRLIDLSNVTSIKDAATRGTSGYVVDSVPFAVFSASRIKMIGMEEMLRQIIECGGDTDTNASISGQIVGALIGEAEIPIALREKLRTVRGYDWVDGVLSDAKRHLTQCN